MLYPETIESNMNNLVTKSNMLIEANYKLGVVEQKIILCLASNIQPSDSDFKTYTLNIKEFTSLLGLKGTPKYTELRQITKELMQKVFEVRIEKKVIQVAWLSYVAYNETEGTIDIRFDPFLRPYLLQLKKEFTSYKLENVVKLKSSYAIRIYELLKQYEKLQERTFQLTDLRKMLGATDIYPAYGNFKQRVLIPAQKELKKKTDISFDIQERKNGRRVDQITFVITSINRNQKETLSFFSKQQEALPAIHSLTLRAKSLGLNLGIQLTDEIILNWEEKYGLEKVIPVLERIQGRKDIENPIGYITSVLRLDPVEAASTSEDQFVLNHLIKSFRKSKEKLQDWFVKEKAIEEIQSHFQLDTKEAKSLFEAIKSTLYEVLNVKDQRTEPVKTNDFVKKKKALEERLKKYKEKC